MIQDYFAKTETRLDSGIKKYYDEYIPDQGVGVQGGSLDTTLSSIKPHGFTLDSSVGSDGQDTSPASNQGYAAPGSEQNDTTGPRVRFDIPSTEVPKPAPPVREMTMRYPPSVQSPYDLAMQQRAQAELNLSGPPVVTREP